MFLDTWAWIAYFQGGPHAQAVLTALRRAPIAFTSPIVLAEIESKYNRAGRPEDARARGDAILERCVVIEPDAVAGRIAGRLHAELRRDRPRLGLADAFILAAARSVETKILTGDPDLKGLPDVDFLE